MTAVYLNSKRLDGEITGSTVCVTLLLVLVDDSAHSSYICGFSVKQKSEVWVESSCEQKEMEKRNNGRVLLEGVTRLHHRPQTLHPGVQLDTWILYFLLLFFIYSAGVKRWVSVSSSSARWPLTSLWRWCLVQASAALSAICQADKPLMSSAAVKYKAEQTLLFWSSNCLLCSASEFQTEFYLTQARAFTDMSKKKKSQIHWGAFNAECNLSAPIW